MVRGGQTPARTEDTDSPKPKHADAPAWYNPWSELSPHERRTYSLFCLVFFFIVGGYWLMRAIKVGVFRHLVGLKHEPQAKFGTVFVLIPILMAYNKLVMVLESPRKLVFTVVSMYAVIFALEGFCLSLPGMGMSNNEADPDRWLGWIVYWTIESFGSICVAMAWSVVASIASQKSATVVYPIITVICQVGAITGATIATQAKLFGFPGLFAIQTLVCVAVIFVVRDIFSNRGTGTLDHGGSGGDIAKHQEDTTGLMEGLRLIATRDYVLYITVMATFGEVVATIMDYQMKVLGQSEYSSPEDFSAFMGHFGQAVNFCSLVFALTGTSFFIKRFGLKFCLLAYPLCTFGVIAAVYAYSSLSVLFMGMVAIKALNYSLNNPSKEMLYIRTSKDIKFKAKSWIDMFGIRGAKAAGSVVNHIFKGNTVMLMSKGSMVGGILVSVWLTVAQRLGVMHEKLVVEDRMVE